MIDGAKANLTPVASFQPFDLSSELWFDYLERFRTLLTANSIPKDQVFLTNQITLCGSVHQLSTNKELVYVTLKHHLISVVPCGSVYDLFKRTLKIDIH